jgi:hypothetical protein
MTRDFEDKPAEPTAGLPDAPPQFQRAVYARCATCNVELEPATAYGRESVDGPVYCREHNEQRLEQKRAQRLTEAGELAARTEQFLDELTALTLRYALKLQCCGCCDAIEKLAGIESDGRYVFADGVLTWEKKGT